MKGNMKNEVELERISAEAAREMGLPLHNGLRAGFGSTVDDYEHEQLDFNREFVRHPEASYYARVRGESMLGVGIADGDLCLVDRDEELFHGNLVVAYLNGGDTLKFIDTSTRDQGYVRLISANPKFKPYIVDADDQFIIQGKVIVTFKDWRRNYCLPSLTAITATLVASESSGLISTDAV